MPNSPQTTYTDDTLKRVLAKMLPTLIEEHEQIKGITPRFTYWHKDGKGCQIKDTELLDLCRSVRRTFTLEQKIDYLNALRLLFMRKLNAVSDFDLLDAEWSDQTIALAKTLRIEIL